MFTSIFGKLNTTPIPNFSQISQLLFKLFNVDYFGRTHHHNLLGVPKDCDLNTFRHSFFQVIGFDGIVVLDEFQSA